MNATSRPPRPKIERRNVTIREIAAGSAWEIDFGEGETQRTETAATALQDVQKRMQALAEAGTSTVAILSWETTSRIGATIVRALQVSGRAHRNGPRRTR